MRKSTPDTARKRVRASTAAATAGSRAGLEREHLVEAALDLLQEAGLDALSTRRLAERLGVKSPALYWHVHNKDELLALATDAICGQMRLPSARLLPRKRLEVIAREYRRVLMKYRDAPRLMSEQPPTGPHRMKLYDAAVGALHDWGFRGAEAIIAATFYRTYLLGMIAEETRQQSAGRAGLKPAHALGVELSQLGKGLDDYPNLRGAARILADIRPEAIFRTGLGMILDGMDRSHGKRRRQARSGN
jgi:TetR/AcrR family tetracycline transcriptional repressor